MQMQNISESFLTNVLRSFGAQPIRVPASSLKTRLQSRTVPKTVTGKPHAILHGLTAAKWVRARTLEWMNATFKNDR